MPDKPPQIVYQSVRPNHRWETQFSDLFLILHGQGFTDVGITTRMNAVGMPVQPYEVALERRRLGLPPNKGKPLQVRNDPPPPRTRPSPISFARDWLGIRLEEKISGFWLDGCPVNLSTIMQEANRVAERQGGTMLLTSERWKP